MYIDTHVHLTDKKFSNSATIIKNFIDAGVFRVINAGYDLSSSEQGLTLSSAYPEIFFAAGIHPDDEKSVDNSAISRLKELSKAEKCVAIGEIGLDYHYEGFDKNGQKKAFKKQLELAAETDLPVIIHSRDATLDTVDILKAYKNELKRGGVMHCFSGSKETAKIFLDSGFYISFSGVVTFKNANVLKEVASYVPSDRYLAETDCPYMAPEPKRGTVNEPQNVIYVFKKLAELRGVSESTVQGEIIKNAFSLFYKLK